MSDLIKRLGWTTSLALSAALLGGCGGEAGNMGGDQDIEVVPQTEFPGPTLDDEMDPMPAPGLDTYDTEPAPSLGTEPAPGLGTEPAPIDPAPGIGTEPTPIDPAPEPGIDPAPIEPGIDPAPADPGTELPAPEQP